MKMGSFPPPADRGDSPNTAPQPGVRNLPVTREGPGGSDNSRANIVKRLNAQQGSGGLIAQILVHLEHLRALPFNQNTAHEID